MKTKILALGMVSCFLFVGCNKDDNTGTIKSADVVSSSKIDPISDDVSQIVETQSNEIAAGRSAAVAEDFLSDCATVTTTTSGNTVTRTINFGDTNCTLNNGNTVRGKIILTFTNDWAATTRTINYSFENFYHNDRHVEGNRHVVRTILPNGHPQATITLNMTVTTPEGAVYTRNGNRVREFSEGYGTSDISDNVFLVSGNWVTTLPSGVSHSASIATSAPLKIKCNCTQPILSQHRFEIVSGVLTIVRNSNTAVIDYGNGDCDNTGTITINNGAPITFTLRN
jgi:hypothetical protein